jgi:hypothetical protein
VKFHTFLIYNSVEVSVSFMSIRQETSWAPRIGLHAVGERNKKLLLLPGIEQQPFNLVTTLTELRRLPSLFD